MSLFLYLSYSISSFLDPEALIFYWNGQRSDANIILHQSLKTFENFICARPSCEPEYDFKLECSVGEVSTWRGPEERILLFRYSCLYV